MQFNRLEAGRPPAVPVAELSGDGVLVATPSDALDVLVSAGCDRIVLHAANLHADFFRLATGLAGEIMQKFANYGVRAAVVGPLPGRPSESLRALVRESRRGERGGPVVFTDTLEEALQRLAR